MHTKENVDTGGEVLSVTLKEITSITTLVKRTVTQVDTVRGGLQEEQLRGQVWRDSNIIPHYAIKQDGLHILFTKFSKYLWKKQIFRT